MKWEFEFFLSLFVLRISFSNIGADLMRQTLSICELISTGRFDVYALRLTELEFVSYHLFSISRGL